jgi:hypothetical protein
MGVRPQFAPAKLDVVTRNFGRYTIATNPFFYNSSSINKFRIRTVVEDFVDYVSTNMC